MINAYNFMDKQTPCITYKGGKQNIKIELRYTVMKAETANGLFLYGYTIRSENWKFCSKQI